MKKIKVDKKFQALIPPLTQDEYTQLQVNILRDGCREPLVEVDGNFLLLDRELATGQRLLLQRLTHFCPATAFVVEGDAKDMSVKSVAAVEHGCLHEAKPHTLAELQERIRKWAEWAGTHSAMPRRR